MNKIIAILLTVLLGAPAVALAQTMPAPAHRSAPSIRPNRAAMKAFGEQQMHLHRAERAQILAALTAAHRQYLASLVGELTIAENPNPREAIERLDARLTPTEKGKILAADRRFRDDERALMQKARAQFEAHMTADQKAKWAQMRAKHPAARTGAKHRAHRTPDAGAIAFRVATETIAPFAGMRRHMMRFGMPGMRGSRWPHSAAASPAP